MNGAHIVRVHDVRSTALTVKIISRETVKFGEFIKAFSNPTGFITFSMEPLIGSSLLAFEPNLVFSLIDCMFGGEGKPIEKIREFTMIERRMLQRIAMAVLKDLETAWDVAYPIRLALRKIETKPEFVYLVNPSDWSEELAAQLARGEGIELTDKHWDLINLFQATNIMKS